MIETVATLDKPLDQITKNYGERLIGHLSRQLKTMGLPMFNSGALQD